MFSISKKQLHSKLVMLKKSNSTSTHFPSQPENTDVLPREEGDVLVVSILAGAPRRIHTILAFLATLTWHKAHQNNVLFNDPWLNYTKLQSCTTVFYCDVTGYLWKQWMKNQKLIPVITDLGDNQRGLRIWSSTGCEFHRGKWVALSIASLWRSSPSGRYTKPITKLGSSTSSAIELAAVGIWKKTLEFIGDLHISNNNIHYIFSHTGYIILHQQYHDTHIWMKAYNMLNAPQDWNWAAKLHLSRIALYQICQYDHTFIPSHTLQGIKHP